MRVEIRPELTEFLTGGGLPCRILVVESLGYLPKLRQMYPVGEIYAVAKDCEQSAKYDGLGVKFAWLDYHETPLPFARQFFDVIISDLTLETAENPQDIAAGFGTYLKETGFWLTSFRNIRYWKIIDDLRDGHYYGLITKLYARPEFERLLYASFYKDVKMAPQINPAPDGMVEELEQAGFENLAHDLEAEFWLVKAARSMPEMALLKSMFTAAQRKKLSRLLHRIEYGIDLAGSTRELWELYDGASMFPDYLAAFIRQAVYHRQMFYRNWQIHSVDHATEYEAVRRCGQEDDCL